MTNELNASADARPAKSATNANQPLIGCLSSHYSYALRRPFSTNYRPQGDGIFLAPAAGNQASSATPQTSQSASTSSTDADNSAETINGGQNTDLEQLADEVYAIIERRLIIERERLGL
jgi:hypothetical protein